MLASPTRPGHTQVMDQAAEKLTTLSDAKASLSKLVELALRGQRVVISRAGKPVVMLVPYRDDTSARKLGGSWEGNVTMADDFDELPADLMRAFLSDDESSP